LTKDIEFHDTSIKLFGKLKADFIFENAKIRKQLTEIINFHKIKRQQDKDMIRTCEQVIKKIHTPIHTPDGKQV